MKVYTSYFGNIRKIPLNFSLLSIAGKTPEWFPGESLKIFAPKYDWWKEWHEKFHDTPDSYDSVEFYTKRYTETVLSKIDVQQVRTMFENLRGTPCLLCYERPEKFCHRHLVADFLNKNEFEVEEF